MSQANAPAAARSRRFRWRRLVQFRLGTLLIIVSLAAIPLGWVGCERERSAREQVVANEIFALGGSAYFVSDTNSPVATTWQFRLRRAVVGERIVDVILTETSVTDLSFLNELTSVKLLFLGKTAIDDIQPLARLYNLKHLSLYKTQVCDLSPLAALADLESLDVRRTKIVDIAPLADLKELRELNLEDTAVRDLSPLAKLSNLKTIYLRGTRVSDKDVQWLKKCLPACKIDSDYSDKQ